MEIRKLFNFEEIMVDWVTWCWAIDWLDRNSFGRRDLVICSRMITLSPMRPEAKRAVPPPSEAEHLNIRVLPTVLDNSLRLGSAVGAGDLGDGLEA